MIGAYSKPARLAEVDGRTKAARLVRDFRRELIAHVGGSPTAVQNALINQAAELRLRLALLDATFAESGAMNGHDLRTYLAWSNSYSRLLRQLGPQGATKKKGNALSDYLAKSKDFRPSDGHIDDPVSLTLLDALGDPNLFGPHFKPHRVYGDTWRAWRVFLKALFAHPMDADELATYEACTGRTDLPTEPVSEAALIVGRRGGKSRVLATVAVWLAAFHDYSEYLAPGELASVSVIASDRRQARAIFRYAKGLLEHTELLETMIEDSNSESIILTNRTTIEIQTASFRAVRGSTLIAALCDEVAFWRDETSANPDVEVLRSIRPALGTIPGALLLLASSPYRKAGELYRAYRENYGKADADVLAFRAGTSTMNPSFPQKIIDRAYETDAEAARAEFGAEFRDDLADYVPREVVDRCTVQGRVELPPFPGMQAVAFCDPAGGSGKDSMTLAIAHLQGDMRVLDLVREVKPPFNPASVIADFAAVLRTYGISRVVGDRFGGEWVRQPFRDAGIEYELADRPKSDIYRDALPLLTSGRVELLDVPRLASQLCGLERRTARSGKDSIDHGPGQHDDLSNSVTGALLLAASGATSYQLSSAYLEGLEAITNGMMM